MVYGCKRVIGNVVKFVHRLIVHAHGWVVRVFDNVWAYKKARAFRKEEERLASIETEDGELVIIYGGLGVGKTTYLCQIGASFVRASRRVYTNIPGTPFVPLPKDYWNYRYPRGSAILIDEIGIIHDNRQYKTLPDEVRDWYKYVRHHSLHVFACSQTADVDKKVRVLATEQELIKKESFLIFFTKVYTYRIIPEIGYIDEETQRFIAEDYYSVVKKTRLKVKKFFSYHNSHSELDIPMYDH